MFCRDAPSCLWQAARRCVPTTPFVIVCVGRLAVFATTFVTIAVEYGCGLRCHWDVFVIPLIVTVEPRRGEISKHRVLTLCSDVIPAKRIGNPEADRRGGYWPPRGDIPIVYHALQYKYMVVVLYVIVSPLVARRAPRLLASGFPIPFTPIRTVTQGLHPVL